MSQHYTGKQQISSVTSNSFSRQYFLNPSISPTASINMGGWFSKFEPEVKAEKVISQSEILQSSSTGPPSAQEFHPWPSSLCSSSYLPSATKRIGKATAELHDIVHSLNRSTPGPEPARQGYPQYPPSVTNFGMAPNIFPMVA